MRKLSETGTQLLRQQAASEDLQHCFHRIRAADSGGNFSGSRLNTGQKVI